MSIVMPIALSLAPMAEATASIFPVPPIHEPASGANISMSDNERERSSKLRIKARNKLRLAEKNDNSIFGPSLNKALILLGSNIMNNMAGRRLLFNVEYDCVIASFVSNKSHEESSITLIYRSTIGGT
jgi:hypothetical protein